MPDGRSLAIITGASQGIGAGLVAGFRRLFGAGTKRSILPGDDFRHRLPQPSMFRAF